MDPAFLITAYCLTVVPYSVYSMVRSPLKALPWLAVHAAFPFVVVLLWNEFVDVVRFRALSSDEASSIIAAAESRSWSSRHKHYPTVDVGGEDWRELVEARVRHNGRLVDLFVVKYDKDGQNSLREHKDQSHTSFTIALTDDRGTCFTAFDYCIENVTAGEAWMHPSRVLHEARPHTTHPPRYVLVGFVDVDGPPWWNTWGAAASQLREWNNATVTMSKRISRFPYLRDRCALLLTTHRDLLLSFVLCAVLSVAAYLSPRP